jgi:hypothetical protein
MLPPEWTVKKTLFTSGGFVYHKPPYTRLAETIMFFGVL